jgi:Ca2+-binding EF-hand superfamily protein
MGMVRLDKIVKEQLEKRAVRYSSTGTKSGTSARNLIRSVFQNYDKDNSGSIDLTEFTQMLMDFGVRNINQEDVNAVFHSYDKDGDGTVDYHELAALFGQSFSDEKGIIDMPSTLASHQTRFMSMDKQKHDVKQTLLTQMKQSKLKMREVFDTLGGASGVIDRNKLKVGLRSKYSVGIGLEPAVDAMLGEIDQNDDGQISFEEFSDAFAPGRHKKFRRKQSVFDGAKMGWERLDKIVQEQLERRAVKYSSVGSKAGTSGTTLIRQVFKNYDKDNSGSIDLAEFTKMIRDWGVRGINQECVNDLFKHYDKDGDNTVDYHELAALFGQSFSDEKGIIDMPSTLASHQTRFMSMDKQKHVVKQTLLTQGASWSSSLMSLSFVKPYRTEDRNLHLFLSLGDILNHHHTYVCRHPHHPRQSGASQDVERSAPA